MSADPEAVGFGGQALPFISASIGISIYPNDAEDRRGLLTQADMALYRAKVDGRCVYRFFEAAMGVPRSMTAVSWSTIFGGRSLEKNSGSSISPRRAPPLV
jgi:Diguanylate cyclase, GGDEF domain